MTNETNMIKFENTLNSKNVHNKNYLNEVDLNEVNFKDLVTNIYSLVGECFIMDESLLQSKRNIINNPSIAKNTIFMIYGESQLRY